MDAVPERFFFEEAVERFDEQPFLIVPEGTFTYGRIDQYVSETAYRLKGAGIKKGQRIAILAPNSMAYVILLMALWKMGAVAAPISTRLAKRQVEENLQLIRASGIILSQGHAGLHLHLFPDMCRFILEDIVPPGIIPSGKGDPESIESWTDGDATIIFTSGSSGRPKAVLHTPGNHIFSALGSNGNIPVGPGYRWLLSLPLYHVGGLAIIFRVILGGGALAFPVSGQSMEDNICELRITHVSLVSTQLYRLLKGSKDCEPLKSLKAILLGGSAIPDYLIKEGIERGLPIFKSYGSSEMASQVTATHLNDSRPGPFSSGKLLDYRQIKIADDNEILLKGRTLFRGYVDGKGIIRAVDDEGWFHSGDLGCLDKYGYLYVTGRKDNMFISGGENIQPEEIEACLAGIDNVREAVVVPVIHPEFGHRPVAFLKLADNSNLQCHCMIKRLEEMLPRFKIPDYFFPWPGEMDRESLKPDRKLLKKVAEDLIHS
ncbi:MAG: o-succinylbenzoate--CoA ligase [bacterium]